MTFPTPKSKIVGLVVPVPFPIIEVAVIGVPVLGVEVPAVFPCQLMKINLAL